MKTKIIGIMAAFMILLMSFSLGADAMMNGPQSKAEGGSGMGPGPDDGHHTGPRWEQETSEKQVGNGLLFRYGMDTPSTTLESEETGSDIGIHLNGVGIKNRTRTLSIDVGNGEWDIDQKNLDDGVEISYTSGCEWREDDQPTGENSQITVRFRYRDTEGSRGFSYNISIADPPIEGALTFSILIDTNDVNDGCSWHDSGTQHDWERKELLLRNSKGEELSKLDLGEPGLVETEDGSTTVETELDGEIVNSTVSLDVGMNLPESTRTASISGSLSILDGLVDALMEGAKETARFVIEHIYYFVGGAVVTAVMIIGAVSIASRKKVETGGSDLDLSRNRYYKGSQ